MNNTTGSESNNKEEPTSNNYGSSGDDGETIGNNGGSSGDDGGTIGDNGGSSGNGGTTGGNGDTTGLPWPRSWKGAYVLVIANFALWLVLLLSLQEFCK